MMERRKALALAGTAAIVIVSGATAMAANLGILDFADARDQQVGNLDSTTVAELVDVRTADGGSGVTYIDQYDLPPEPDPYSADDGDYDYDDHDDHDDDHDDHDKDKHDKDKHDKDKRDHKEDDHDDDDD